ncbi:hypothetical protein B0T14DRAFT_515240 [Immersiella caudata]|uniref:DUF3074 domain-containing protein n=1 Tax=Immersiella caudata TaxID=314043 RepID=A0AA40C3J9_9PEZI|nr:hypothetical protein B0T14DRAFT_515240 [Immersiella caudata]
MAHHEPFKALGALPWETLISESESDRQTALANLLRSTFSSAQILIDSIPSDTNLLSSNSHNKSTKSPTTTRARSQTDSAVNTNQPNPLSLLLQKEWKQIKTSPRDNPLGIQVHKLSARDGNGSWFSRRSVHRDVPFPKWVLGLRREFAETSVLRSGKADSSSVRGLGAEKRVERVVVEGVGTAEVYLVSVRFPGPTTPRDFVTVVLMPDGDGEGRKGERRFMLVSRPCEHGGCPARQGFIRGTYESVEMVREVREDGVRGVRRTRSSDDLGGETGEGEELRFALARRAVEEGGRHGRTATISGDGGVKTASSSPGPRGESEEGDKDEDVAVEWLMVTRSDPGGSVPRFMVEKGTPGGIINDAGRFLNWVTHKKEEELRAAIDAGTDELDGEDGVISPEEKNEIVAGQDADIKAAVRTATDETDETVTLEVAPPTGFYGMIASALEAAGSLVISRMSSIAGSAAGSLRTDSELDDNSDSESDTSELSFASAEEGSLAQSAVNDVKESPSIPDLASSSRSIQSTVSSGSHSTPVAADQKHDKELQRLQERRRRAHEKMVRMQEKMASKRKENDSGKDKEAQEAALAKLREKHEREMAKHEEKFQRDMVRLQEKRANELRKAEDRRRKAEEREERRNLYAELEKIRAERDVALREMEVLKEYIGALQSQNTMLVARLGREGSSASVGKV